MQLRVQDKEAAKELVRAILKTRRISVCVLLIKPPINENKKKGVENTTPLREQQLENETSKQNRNELSKCNNNNPPIDTHVSAKACNKEPLVFLF